MRLRKCEKYYIDDFEIEVGKYYEIESPFKNCKGKLKKIDMDYCALLIDDSVVSGSNITSIKEV